MNADGPLEIENRGNAQHFFPSHLIYLRLFYGTWFLLPFSFNQITANERGLVQIDRWSTSRRLGMYTYACVLVGRKACRDACAWCAGFSCVPTPRRVDPIATTSSLAAPIPFVHPRTLYSVYTSDLEEPYWYTPGVGNSQLGCTKIRDSREILEIPKDSMRGEIGRFWPGRTRVYEDSGELPTPLYTRQPGDGPRRGSSSFPFALLLRSLRPVLSRLLLLLVPRSYQSLSTAVESSLCVL